MNRIRSKVAGFSWRVDSTPSSLNPKYSNADMDPVSPALRTWSTASFCLLWISDSFNAATWELSSSMISSGLSWKQSLAAVIVAQLCITVPIILNGTAGALVHVSPPFSKNQMMGLIIVGAVSRNESIFIRVLVFLFLRHFSRSLGHVSPSSYLYLFALDTVQIARSKVKGKKSSVD